jgi:hypothetical protein
MDLIAQADWPERAFGCCSLLLAVKFLFTGVSYGSGVPGGVFFCRCWRSERMCGSSAAAVAVRFGFRRVYRGFCRQRDGGRGDGRN